MIERTAKAISRILVREGACRSDDAEVAAFGLETLIADSLQVLILLGLSLLFGVLPPIFLFSLCYVLLRRYIGGAHARSHFWCILTFTLTALVCVCAGLRVSPVYARAASAILAVFAVAVVFLRAPVGHPDAPRSAGAIARFRRIGRITSLVEGAVIIAAAAVLPDRYIPLALCAALGGCAAALTLLIPVHNADDGDADNDNRKGGKTDAHG